MSATTGDDIYQSIIRRIALIIPIIGIPAAIIAGVLKGPRYGFGFLVGAVLSSASFWRWKKVVDAVGGPAKQRSAWTWLIRFAVLIGAAYVTVKYLGVSPEAVFLGLLVSAAAVIVALIFELIHGNKGT